MRNPFKQFILQFNKYSRSDRNAILILSGLILIVLISNAIYNKLSLKSAGDFPEYELQLKELEEAFSDKSEIVECFFPFDPNVISKNRLDSISLPDYVKRNILNYREAGGKFRVPADLNKIYGMNDSIFSRIQSFIVIKKELPEKFVAEKETIKKNYSGTFDPNLAKSDDFKKFGFNNYQIRNILSYRNKGGAFRAKIDLLKIYGVDSVFFLSIEKHIKIEESPKDIRIEFKKADTKIELNGADSLQLVKLNGVGPVYASRIIKYRKLLGGFYSKEQLLEVYTFPEETFRRIENLLFVDSTLINPIRINFADYNDLLKHPYLNKSLVDALIKFREKNGAFENIADLELVKEVDSLTRSKISPYLTCR